MVPQSVNPESCVNAAVEVHRVTTATITSPMAAPVGTETTFESELTSFPVLLDERNATATAASRYGVFVIVTVIAPEANEIVSPASVVIEVPKTP